MSEAAGPMPKSELEAVMVVSLPLHCLGQKEASFDWCSIDRAHTHTQTHTHIYENNRTGTQLLYKNTSQSVIPVKDHIK